MSMNDREVTSIEGYTMPVDREHSQSSLAFFHSHDVRVVGRDP